MAIFCSNCGKPVCAGEKFCKECGSPIRQAEPKKPICPHCGKEMKLTSKFCPHCGKNSSEPRASSIEPEPVRPAPSIRRTVQAVQNTVAKLPELSGSVSASSETGAMTVSIPVFSGAADTVNSVTAGTAQILSPVRTLFSGIVSFFGNIKAVFKDKKAMVGVIIMSLVWIALWLWNRSSGANSVSGFLSALTFAEGGTRGTFGQIVGGAFGKGLVISGFASLFDGGLRELFGGAKRLFDKGLSIGWAVFGLGAAVLCYQLFAGYAGTYGIAVGVSGAVLSLQALGGELGFLRSLAQSLTAKKASGARVQNDVRLKSLLTGVVTGFILSAVLSALYIPWWIPVIIMAVGLVLGLVFKEKAVQS